ncbi:MAG TPA: HD domain-containing protein [Streptosporangiaceae bacterium]|nr:HD domain-containing protein [Streptosporangiaceae bacterium]
MERLDEQLRFIKEIDRLKTVLRQSPLVDASRRENSAEHSWHLAVMAVTLGEYAPPGTDLNRVLTMVLLHDIVEIDAGDTFLYATDAVIAEAERAERAAADRIFALLPADQAAALRAVWMEFEDRRTPAARFARALDRLQPMLANYHTGGGTWRAHGVTADRVLAKVRLIEEGSAALGGYARDLVAASVEKGFLAPAPLTG